jgi:arylsulfatase
VLPLDDRRVERFNADLAGRPQRINGDTKLLFEAMGRLSESSMLVIKNTSHAVNANVTVPDRGAEGVIMAQDGAFAGVTVPPLAPRRRHTRTPSGPDGRRASAHRRH